MKPIYSLILAVVINFLPTFSRAQNLIPNPGFEQYDSLPCDFIQSNSEFALYIQDWFLPTGGTSDIISTQISSTCNYGHPLSFNSCGNQYPRTGDAMVGVVNPSYDPLWQEYVEVQLSSPTIPGRRYYFECYVLLADCSNFTCNNFGAAVTVNSFLDTNTTGFINITPVVHDISIINSATTWKRISGCFDSDSAYQYILLGHFQNDCDTSSLHTGSLPSTYCFIDDVYLGEDSTCEDFNVDCISANSISAVDDNKIKWSSDNEHLTLSTRSEKGSFMIYSSDGKKVIQKSISDSDILIDISDFSEGLYLAVVINSRNNTSQSFKFIKW